MKFLSLLLFMVSTSALSNECSVELFSKIYRLEQDQALQTKDIVRNTNCPETIIGKLSTVVSNSQGTISSDFIKRELEKDFPEFSINFSENKISLMELNSTIRNQLTPESNLFFTQTKSLNGLSAVALMDGETIQVICDSCQSYGVKNIKLNIINIMNNSSRTVWFVSKIMAQVKVVKPKRSISFQQKSLDANDFYYDEILTMTPDNLITSIENIQFFKANRTLIQGSTISNLDLQPVNLVSYGTPVKVQLKTKNISLEKSAMPVRSARFGDTVELKGPNNKLIAGKVVDYNKVVIEL